MKSSPCTTQGRLPMNYPPRHLRLWGGQSRVLASLPAFVDLVELSLHFVIPKLVEYHTGYDFPLGCMIAQELHPQHILSIVRAGVWGNHNKLSQHETGIATFQQRRSVPRKSIDSPAAAHMITPLMMLALPSESCELLTVQGLMLFRHLTLAKCAFRGWS